MSDELDRMISREDEIVPSSGFVSSVMDAVRQEAAASQSTAFPPIPFPWVRALPGFIALGTMLAMLIAVVVQAARLPASVPSHALPEWLDSWVHTFKQTNSEWIAFAFLLALFSVYLSFRLAKETPEDRATT